MNSVLKLIFIVAIGICAYGKDSQKLKKPIDLSHEEEYQKLNLTKRALNLYITQNGKHVVVLNKTLNDPMESTSKVNLIDYRIGKPPFLIKNRGTILLLHNSTGENAGSLNWHYGYPSMIQMLSASGHTTIAPELLSTNLRISPNKTTNLKLIEQILEAENFNETNKLVIVADSQSDLAVEILHQNPKRIDGLVLINPSDKWRITLNMESARAKITAVPTLFIRDQELNASQLGKYQKTVQVHKPSELESRTKLAQVLANYLDFIHPR